MNSVSIDNSYFQSTCRDVDSKTIYVSFVMFWLLDSRLFNQFDDCYLGNRKYLHAAAGKILRIQNRVSLNSFNMYSEYVRNRILSLANFNKSPTIVRILSAENIVVVRSTISRIIQRSREKEAGRQ